MTLLKLLPLTLTLLLTAHSAFAFTTIEAAARGIASEGHELQARGDRRSLFARVYGVTIAATIPALKRGEFYNPAWVKKLVVNYANLYQRTLTNELNGQRSRLPLAWQDEFAYIDLTHAWTPKNPDGFLWSSALDLVYGIHVHITRDLVEALLLTPTDFNSATQQADFLHITEVLRGSMGDIWTIFVQYPQEVSLGADLDQQVLIRWIAKLRAQVWEDAKAASLYSPGDQQRYLSALDAAVAAQSKRDGIFMLF